MTEYDSPKQELWNESWKEYLPHGVECRFIDDILERSESRICCRIRCRSNDPESGPDIPAAIGVEYLAQASALLCAPLAAQSSMAQGGVVASLRSFHCSRATLALGTALLARVEVSSRGSDIALFDCSLADELSGEVLMHGRLSIAFGSVRT